MDEIKSKQQVIEKIKEASKILVTVSDNPTVDALSAALGLTLLLDKQEKYATAIFSGETPPAIAFLEPEKTFDDTTDSLRDFIIALNKEKADHLRYKVEGDAVKIFITPYKTTISQDDLDFSQGDYNVELVIALGVDNQDHLDGALENHGQILHDAAIITMTSGDQTSDLGGVDWHDSQSSSLSEMVAGLAEALKDDKKKSLLDAPIATALLTGIVAETDRFSNAHTTSRAMTVAASLMAAGADQQLIATELQNSHEIGAGATPTGSDDNDDSEVEVDNSAGDGGMTIKKDGLSISHEGETLADLDRRVRGEKKAKEKVTEEVEAAQEEAAEDEQQENNDEPVVKAVVDTPVSSTPAVSTAYAAEDDAIEPILGGTLNATTEQAAEDARRAAENDQNKTILSHSYLGSEAPAATTVADGPEGFPGTPQVAPGSMGVNDAPSSVEEVHSAYAMDDEPVVSDVEEAPATPSLAVGGERVIQPLSDAATSVAAPAFNPIPPAPPAPEPGPADLGLPLPPPIPDFSQVATPPPAIPLPPTQQPEILGDILAPEPAPAVTDASIAPAFEPQAPGLPPLEQAQPPVSNDPAQFKIPGQQ